MNTRTHLEHQRKDASETLKKGYNVLTSSVGFNFCFGFLGPRVPFLELGEVSKKNNLYLAKRCHFFAVDMFGACDSSNPWSLPFLSTVVGCCWFNQHYGYIWLPSCKDVENLYFPSENHHFNGGFSTSIWVNEIIFH